MGERALTVLFLVWLAGAVVAFAVWLVTTLRTRSNEFRRMWAPTVLTAALWPVVLVLGALAWVGSLVAGLVRRRG